MAIKEEARQWLDQRSHGEYDPAAFRAWYTQSRGHARAFLRVRSRYRFYQWVDDHFNAIAIVAFVLGGMLAYIQEL